MGVVILTRHGIEHRYVVDRIVRGLGDQVQAILLHEPPPKTIAQRAREHRKRYTNRQLLSRSAARLYRAVTRADAGRDETVARILFPQGDPGTMPIPERTHVVPSHNGPEAHALLDELQPDVIAVYGTLIIRPPTIRRARRAILNMHTGISPRYRGADTYFWPLYNEEPEWVGTTIHYLDEGVDSGPIIAVVRPVIEADDSPDSLFAKCVVAGADRYVDAVGAALDGTLVGEDQDLTSGRNYLAVDRTVAAERRVRRLLREGLLASVSSS